MIRFAENLNKMITAGLGGALEAPSTEVAVGHRIRYMDASGPVATFETNIAAPIRSLRVDMQPIQDLHGQDAPYPAGGGKNKFDKDTAVVGKWLDVNTGEEGNTSTNYALSDWIPVKSGTTYIFTDTKSSRCWAYDVSKNPLAAITIGKPYTATADGYIRLTISIIDVSLDTFMVVEGSTLPSTYSPYENICPISGRDSVTVWREAVYDPSADSALTIQLGQTVYGGTYDVVSGELKVDWAFIESYNGEEIPGEWISDRDSFAPDTTPTIGAQVCYRLSTPEEFVMDPVTLSTLEGLNNVWSDAGDVALKYPYYEETEGY